MLLLGDQWTLLILQRIFHGLSRFQDLRDALKVSDSVLASRLRELVEHGLLVRVPYRGVGRTRQEYRLTDSGLATWPLLTAIRVWEERWAGNGTADSRPAPVSRVHRRCGRSTLPVLGCLACGRRITVADTDARLRSSADAYERASPRRRHRQARTGPVGDPIAFRPETMELLGDRWSTALLGAAFLRVRRFSDFQRDLRIPPSVLAHRLHRFVDLDVLRHGGPAGADVREYRLTAKGRAFFDVLALLIAWGEENLPTPDGPQLVILHRGCGPLHAALVCDRCGGRIRCHDLLSTDGPAGPARIAAEEPPARTGSPAGFSAWAR